MDPCESLVGATDLFSEKLIYMHKIKYMDILSTSLHMSVYVLPTFIAAWKANIQLEVSENKVVIFSASKFTDPIKWL
jgi:hypothetical protein